jgi:hypothetical protein
MLFACSLFLVRCNHLLLVDVPVGTMSNSRRHLTLLLHHQTEGVVSVDERTIRDNGCDDDDADDDELEKEKKSERKDC